MPGMKAMILAAGRGERLRPLTNTCPKPLIHAAGRPLIYYHLHKLKKAGLRHVWINTAWLGNMIEDKLRDGKEFGLTIHYSHEAGLSKEGLDIAGGIAQIVDQLGQDPFLVISADMVTDFDYAGYQHLVNRMRAKNAKAHLIVHENFPFHPNGDFTLTDDNLIAFKENNPDSATYTFSGVGIYCPEIFDTLPRGRRVRLIDALRPYILNHQVSGQYDTHRWINVGTVEELKAADLFLSSSNG
jgi:MurNAc alpha-1-phosphate uridylyltransferase